MFYKAPREVAVTVPRKYRCVVAICHAALSRTAGFATALRANAHVKMSDPSTIYIQGLSSKYIIFCKKKLLLFIGVGGRRRQRHPVLKVRAALDS